MVYSAEQLIWDQRVGSSNLSAPTINVSIGLHFNPFPTFGYRNYTYLISNLKPTYLKLKILPKKGYFYPKSSSKRLVDFLVRKTSATDLKVSATDFLIKNYLKNRLVAIFCHLVGVLRY